MLLTIFSTNPNLSYILAKNPLSITESGTPFEREVRNGRAYGWFSNEQATQFRLLFIDSPVDNSFSESEFEYLDMTRYASPYAPIAMLSKCLSSALSKPHELDTPEFETTVSAPIKVPLRTLSRAAGSSGLNVSWTPISEFHFEVCVKDKTVAGALNTLQLLCAIACMNDEDVYIPLPQEAVEKYVNSLVRIDAPYFLRHLLVSRMITNKPVFDKLKDKLCTDQIRLEFGNTQAQRFNEVSKILTGGETLLDIGCGEMYASQKLSRVYDTVFAIDADQSIAEANQIRVKKKQLDEKIFPMHAIVDANWVEENASIIEGSDVLLGECLEHMDQAHASSLVRALLMASPRKIVATVPNYSFNVNFAIPRGEFRHNDHRWEPTESEWLDFVKGAAGSAEGWVLKHRGIGDVVNGEPLTFLCVFEKD